MRFFGNLSRSGVQWRSVCSIRSGVPDRLGARWAGDGDGTEEGVESVCLVFCVAAVLLSFVQVKFSCRERGTD
jgi:hypothetical protein